MYNLNVMFQTASDGAVQSPASVSAAWLIGNGQTVVAAITGKKIRLVGWDVQGTAAGFPVITLKCTSVTLVAGRTIPNNAAGVSDKLPYNPYGYAETATGEALKIDVATANMMGVFQYIAYTPA
jgi:hypothetical protein